MTRRSASLAPVLALALLVSADAQPVARRATNLTAILAYPGFYHGRPVVLVGTVAFQQNGQLQVSDEAGSVRLVFLGSAPDGLDEIRGEFWDIGRLKPDDPRLTAELRATFRIDPDAAWPRPGEVTAIIATAVAPAAPPAAASIRTIVMNPTRYTDQKVTITGQFSGRNLLGDLPDAPAKSRYDFVLRSADAAIWIANMRPKLKDAASGKEIELGLDARIDTGRWLTVRGTLQQGRGLQWLEAEAGSLAFAKPPTETKTEDEPIRVPAGPPPEVIFSAPTDEETDVSMATTVRIQFSRDLNPATLKGHIHVHYLESQSVERGEPVTPEADFAYQYNAASRVVELKFTKPLERFRTLKVEAGEDILGTDGQRLKPWTLTFSLGGS